MQKSLLIARSNMRKAVGQAAAIVVLILLAAMMLNLWLMLAMDYKANFDRYHDRLNAEHVTLAVDGDTPESRAFLAQTLQKDARVDAFRMDACMHMVVSFDYNGGRMNTEAIFVERDIALSRSIGKAEIVEEGDGSSGIYLPMLYKDEKITVGKPFELSIGSEKVTYTVCGFFNSVMMGSNNCAMTEFILTEDKYKEMQALGYTPEAVLCSVRLPDRAESQVVEADLKTAISDRFPLARAVSNSYALVAQSRYISQMICSAVVSAMAFFVLLIALIVIASNIINYIQVNMKDLGALKAIGYTSGQLIGSLLVQFLGLSLLAALTGIGLSYVLFPGVNAMMIGQTGIPYAVRFLPVPFVLTLAILGAAVAASVWLAARRIKRIEPITALRSGLTTHNFKRNRLPLERAKAPLNLALALKSTLSDVKHNVTVCATMLVLSLVVVFSGLMLENMIWDMRPFLNLIVGETADVCINVQAEAEDAFFAAAEADERVDKLYLYHSVSVWHVGGVELMATLCDDFAKVNNQSVVFEGRYPRFDNEIAIAAKYAREQGLAIGDEIEITTGGRQMRYLITGFTQGTNNLGKDCMMTRAGYERLGALTNTSYYLTLFDMEDIDGFSAWIEDQFAESVNAVINIWATVDGVAGVYVALMTTIVAGILALSAIIIVFVLYLLVRTVLNRKNRDYGILKALGFTTGQLVLQTALSFMPTIVLSTAVGLFVCSCIINPLTALFLSGIGIVKCTFIVPAGFIAAAGVGIVLFAFAVLCLLSWKIRRITPRALLAGE